MLLRLPQFIVLVFLVALTTAARAETIGRPIYNPHTKSYFELRSDNSEGYWKNADKRAQVLTYKGVRGRLAVVKTPEAHQFLSKHFDIKEETWIGLQYWCKFRKLVWVSGELHDRKDYSPWAASWRRQEPIAPCAGSATVQDGYMPVYYSTRSAGFRWQAVNSGKGFKRYFVEYPTGGE